MAAEWEIVVWHQAKLDVAMKSIVSETVSFSESRVGDVAANVEDEFKPTEGGLGGGAMAREAESFNVLEVEDGVVYGVFEHTVYISDPRYFKPQTAGKPTVKKKLES